MLLPPTFFVAHDRTMGEVVDALAAVRGTAFNASRDPLFDASDRASALARDDIGRYVRQGLATTEVPAGLGGRYNVHASDIRSRIEIWIDVFLNVRAEFFVANIASTLSWHTCRWRGAARCGESSHCCLVLWALERDAGARAQVERYYGALGMPPDEHGPRISFGAFENEEE